MRSTTGKIIGFALATAFIASPALSDEPAPPPAPALEYAFDITVLLDKAETTGDTSIGGRNIVPILGGKIDGPGITGEVLPGGWDWQLERRDGCIGIKADYMLKTSDGVVVNILDTGVNCLPAGGTVPPRTQPVFEAPRGKYDWLNKAAFIGAAQPYAGTDGSGLKIRVYQVK